VSPNGASLKRPLLLVATGPTTGRFAFEPFRDYADAIAINDAYKFCDFAHTIYATDSDWWKYHEKDLRDHPAKKYALRCPGDREFEICTYLENLGRSGFSFCEGHVFSGHNSGYAALQLAVIQGYTDIYLVGFDMGVTGRTHCFGDHPIELRHWSDYSLFISDFASIGENVKSKVNIRLATQPSGLAPFFEYRSPADVLRHCKKVGGRY